MSKTTQITVHCAVCSACKKHGEQREDERTAIVYAKQAGWVEEGHILVCSNCIKLLLDTRRHPQILNGAMDEEPDESTRQPEFAIARDVSKRVSKRVIDELEGNRG
ncbi:MAG: hypothetical protein ACYTEQ_05310 [Planctomycetota bacterium]